MSDRKSLAQELMVRRLRALKESIERKISDEIAPRLKEEKVSDNTKAELYEKLEDLRKSLREIATLEHRLERL